MGGNVGIGTTTPANPLSVRGSSTSTFAIDTQNATGSAIVKIGDDWGRGFLQVMDNSGTKVVQLSGFPANNPGIFLNASTVNQTDAVYAVQGAGLYLQVGAATNSENGIFFSNSPSGGQAGAAITHLLRLL